jgi:hypothetical protein
MERDRFLGDNEGAQPDEPHEPAEVRADDESAAAPEAPASSDLAQEGVPHFFDERSIDPESGESIAGDSGAFGVEHSAESSLPSVDSAFASFLGPEVLPGSLYAEFFADDSIASDIPWPLASFSIDAFAGGSAGAAIAAGEGPFVNDELPSDDRTPAGTHHRSGGAGGLFHRPADGTSTPTFGPEGFNPRFPEDDSYPDFESPLGMLRPIVLVDYEDRDGRLAGELDAFAERMTSLNKQIAKEEVRYAEWVRWTEERRFDR